MSHLVLSAALLAFAGVAAADEKTPAGKSAPAATLKPFQGVWVTHREKKDGDRIVQSRLFLTFKGDTMMLLLEKDGKKQLEYPFQVSESEPDRFVPGLIVPTRVVLTVAKSRYALCYEFVDDKLVLVGNLPNRPFEGLSLSGTFARTEAPK